VYRILVVEDNEESASAISLHLVNAGFVVTLARNGWEALLALDRNSPDLIILDLMMPGMDGITFLKIMRSQERQRDLPAVVITAMEVDEAIAKTRDYQVTRVIAKTADFYDQLTSAVRQILPDPTTPAKT
jgi:CheY-like chemotaxis protein